MQESANSAPAIVVATNDAVPAVDAAVAQTNAPPPEAAVQDLETAPARLVSAPQPAAAANLNAAAAEVAKLAQSGVDENVMLAFVTNSTHTFNLSSDQIIYLNDIGVPGNVVTAMIQRDANISVASTPPPQPAAPVYSTPTPAQETQPATAVEAPLTPPANEPANVNVTYSYFYDSLSPYGNWIEVDGYGRCWQPTVVVVDRGWTPYGSRGHWVYSDCGWYWASDYSWGWAPFHYGRWFRHNYWGWCWAPDTVWGPAWVSWRYTSGYCGWAPLPPTACFRPGIGFTYYGRPVGASFSFGLSIGAFTFVASDRFCDPRPWHYREPHDRVTRIYNNTTIINPVVDRHDNPRFHRGIPPHEITAVTHTEIKPVRVHETSEIPRGHRGENIDRDRGTLTVFRPHLPEAPATGRTGTRVGEGIRPATPNTAIPNVAGGDRMHRTIPHQQTSDANQTPSGLRRFDNNGRQNSGIATQQSGPDRNNSPSVSQSDSANRGTRDSRTQRPVPALNNHEPRDPQISRGHPETMPQPNAQQAPRTPTIGGGQSSDSTARSAQTHRNELLLNRRQQQQFNQQPQVNVPRVESQPTQPQIQQSPRMQVQPPPSAPLTPRFDRSQQPEQRTFRQETPRFQQPATPPVQRQVEPRVFQQSQPSFTPAPAPAVRSQPAPAAPQIQAPQRSAPAVRQNDGGGSRQSDDSHGRGGRQR